ncbi:MAG: LacI family transcriptional regulator [Balneola sp.]|jgi:LacI family transcriptional regulator|nr:LacI family transcriptional regulator [Balneola sp.]MBE79478.1 LacI family transcriptional regulator [Balneola sp.]|tara:strand:+ start:1742 stop:2761 length:1020 start_codon:yes stop_codon:yes gene_type:complete
MNKKVTIYEVAKRAEVAISTVSRVLNGSENVSKATKEKVEKAIDELNFRPQVSARKLASKEPQMLAIAVPSFTTPYFNEVLKGVKDEIKKMDLDIIMYNTGSKQPEEAVQNFFDRGTADAVILLSIDVSDKVHKLIQATQTPAVLVNAQHPSYNYFMLNDYQGGYLAGEHLVKQGFENLGMITSVIDSRASQQRLKGYTDALKNYKMKVDKSLFMSGDSTKHGGFTEESGFEAIYKFDKQGKFPDAIFCSNDTQAVGAIYALSKLGLKVPDDIAIMGYDNIKLSKYLELTTIDQKMYTIGVQATKRLAEIITKPDDELYQTTINPVLVKRGSTENKKAK